MTVFMLWGLILTVWAWRLGRRLDQLEQDHYELVLRVAGGVNVYGFKQQGGLLHLAIPIQKGGDSDQSACPSDVTEGTQAGANQTDEETPRTSPIHSDLQQLLKQMQDLRVGLDNIEDLASALLEYRALKAAVPALNTLADQLEHCDSFTPEVKAVVLHLKAAFDGLLAALGLETIVPEAGAAFVATEHRIAHCTEATNSLNAVVCQVLRRGWRVRECATVLYPAYVVVGPKEGPPIQLMEGDTNHDEETPSENAR
jgi:molecular chaperone GrpE (heat shock protein)